ncbi:MAG: hypothetical protein BECKG1743D_GA0114223_103044 [Candidatus Kentron sp. G]|nr:MAG: hypothetical protein BECKG1743F_GA0114225_102304 [Candidatus Kentron sp. G]VFN01727.1 MAG: hypothetical protein BECKG1743D_GA0114223_103044 [Candidatus Kentron sp. G]VFN05927.1 MAG: hypothetical protein BECKG1743E_GA0114224_109391 [Candidatus Kentron sp. G]
MRLLLRLESGQNDRAIRYILFRQSPNCAEAAKKIPDHSEAVVYFATVRDFLLVPVISYRAGNYNAFLAFSAKAANAGWSKTARSDSTFRSISIPAFLRPFIRRL